MMTPRWLETTEIKADSIFAEVSQKKTHSITHIYIMFYRFAGFFIIQVTDEMFKK